MPNQITRTQYKAARRLLRANGSAALRWMEPEARPVMERCIGEKRAIDALAVRAELIGWCKEVGTTCTPKQTRDEAVDLKASAALRPY